MSNYQAQVSEDAIDALRKSLELAEKLAKVASNRKEQIESLQQQLAEAKECGERFEVKWAAAFDSNEEFARNVRELKHERDKLQGLVGAWHNYFKKIGKQVLEHDPQQKTHIGGLVSQALALSLDNLPRFVPESEVCELALCESIHLGLRQDQYYIFKVIPGCAECERLAKENALPNQSEKEGV